jgi:hypothetical protein
MELTIELQEVTWVVKERKVVDLEMTSTYIMRRKDTSGY